jgi:O-antigen ligase
MAGAVSARQSALFTILVSIVAAVLVGLAMAKLGTVRRQSEGVLVILAGLTMAVTALRPGIGLVILITLMPFEFHFYGTGSDELLLIAVALMLVWRIRARAIPGWVSLGGLALIIGSFVAAIGAKDHTTAIWGGVRWLAAIICLLAVLEVLRKSRDAPRRMVDIFTGSAVVVVLFAFAQKAGIYVLVGAPYIAGYPNSFLGFYTVYAGYVAMAATLATGELLVALTRGRTARAGVYGAALVLLLAGLVLSSSRGGVLALACGWLALLALNIRRGSIFVNAVAVLLIVAGAAYIATPHEAIVRIETRLSASNGSQGEDQTRFALHKVGDEALAQRPFGLGYGNFAEYLEASARNTKITQSFFHAHETPIQIGLDAGWLGLFGFLILVVRPIWMVLENRGRGPAAVRATAFAAALIGFMAQGLYDYLFYNIAFLIFFLAMVWGVIHSLSGDKEPFPNGHFSAGR